MTDSPIPPTVSAELVEKMARIIDPSSWRVFDGYLADVKRKYKGENAGYDPEAFKDKASMAKAREILALLPTHPPSPSLEAAARALVNWWRSDQTGNFTSCIIAIEAALSSQAGAE